MTTEELHNLYLQNQNIVTDSRLKVKNGIFFALKGANFDANTFAKAALENGCAYAIIDNDEYKENDQYIVVHNTLDSLQKLAKYHRKYLNIPIIGITGSNGKTTSKELINAVLERKFNTSFTQGNFNNHIGVPLTILSMNSKTELGIVEMGANHVGEIDFLCKIADPDFGLITNVGKAHIEGFGSFENIVNAKTELYRHIKEKSGKLFLNASDEILSKKAEGISSFAYGTETALVTGSVLSLTPFLQVSVCYENEDFEIKTQLLGAYNISNILAAFSVGVYFAVPIKEIVSALENYTPSNNRSQLLKTASNTLFLDAYNANPSSMKVSLDSFNASAGKDKVAILGEMKELGDCSIQEHTELKEYVLGLGFNQVFFIGNWHTTGQGHYRSTEEFISELKSKPINNKHILIKGSRGNRLETIVEFL